jgi:ABC-type nitrate/sulfonate/bicarbonate transport system substrate-binding protein
VACFERRNLAVFSISVHPKSGLRGWSDKKGREITVPGSKLRLN